MSKLNTVIGHEAQRADLEADIARDNVAHAYLFSGPRHVGKLTVAYWFAQKLLTRDRPSEEHAAIGKSIERLTHSDLMALDTLWIDGVSDDWDEIAKRSNVPQHHRSKKPTAKTNVISIDDIRGLQERLHETGLGRHRVCIIRSVERMQDAAANAFLKILEEPPQGLVFILTTQAQGRLLPTIISRARTVRFMRLPYEEMVRPLVDMSDDDRQFILGLSQGAPGIALALRDDPDLLRKHKQVHAQAHSFWSASSFGERIKLLKPLEQRGEEADSLLLHLALALRENKRYGSLKPLIDLMSDLGTNAHRQLQMQRFVLRTADQS